MTLVPRAAFQSASMAMFRLMSGGPEIRELRLVRIGDQWAGIADIPTRWQPDVAPQPDEDQREAARADLLQWLVGEVTARFVSLKDWNDVDLEGFDHNYSCRHTDVQFLQDRLMYLHANDGETCFHEYWVEAIQFVQREWNLITDLAVLLLNSEALCGGEIARWWNARMMLSA